MRKHMSRFASVGALTVIVGGLGVGVSAASPEPRKVSPTPVARESATTLFWDNFDGPLNQSQWERASIAPDWTKSQARFLPENAYTEGSTLRLLTRRHCVNPGVLPNHLNVNPNPCPSGKDTRYSAGRVNGAFQTPAGINWEIRASVLLPSNGKPGTRVAVWGKNNQPYCKDSSTKTLLGEVDLIEWYPDTPNTGDSVTHMSCSGSLAEPEPKRWATKQHKSPVNFNDGPWYEWVAQRIGNQVTYYISDGYSHWKIADHACGETAPVLTFSGGTCDAILDDPFHAILQTEVFVNSGWSGHPGPNKDAYFPDQYTLVDWVRISQL